MEPRGIFSMAVLAEVLAAALAEDGSRRLRPGAVPDYCFTVDGRRMLYDVKRISFSPSRYWPTVAVASTVAVGGRLSTGHLSFVLTESETTRLNTRRQLPRSMPRQRPGTDGLGPLPQSEHRRQSNISSPRSLRFAAWSSAAPLLRLRGVQGGRRHPYSGCVVVSPASVALAWRPLHARCAVLHDLDAAVSRLRSVLPRPLRTPASASHVLTSSGAPAATPAAKRLLRAL